MDYDSQFTELEYLLELKEIDRHQPMTEEIQYIDVSVYENPNILAKEKEQIFNKFPLMAGHITQLKEIGSYILSDWDDFPYIIIKGEDEKIRAFMNVCRHRMVWFQLELLNTLLCLILVQKSE